MLQRSALLNLELPPVWQLSQRIPRRRQIGILFGGNPLCAFTSLIANASHAKDYQRDAAEKEWRRGLDIGAEGVSKDRKCAPFGDPQIRQNRYRENHQGISKFSKDRFRQTRREETLQALNHTTPYTKVRVWDKPRLG